jgi:hypothetical protein
VLLRSQQQQQKHVVIVVMIVVVFVVVITITITVIIIIIIFLYFQLSEGIWNKFMIHQQTEDTFRKKMMLWKCLYNVVQVQAMLT